jgi:hypothetical protein
VKSAAKTFLVATAAGNAAMAARVERRVRRTLAIAEPHSYCVSLAFHSHAGDGQATN